MSVLGSGTNVHIVGVGGAGMSGLARLLVEIGAKVSGSDLSDSVVLEELRTLGVTVSVGHESANSDHAHVVLWSPAVPADNVELLTAQRAGATMLSRSQVLAELATMRPVIGLTGTHGKTTATSMMVHVLAAAGRDDGRLLGADVLGVGANGHWGSGDLILEVDESYGTFGMLRPHALGLLNVEADHLDHYGTLHVLEEAFSNLIDRTTGPVVVWSDDQGARRVSALAHREVLTVGTHDDSEWRVSNVEVTKHEAAFSLSGPAMTMSLTLHVTGAHNVYDAAVVAVLARSLGVGVDAIAEGLAAFQGAPRRFELLGSWRDLDVYESYAHLPGEISAIVTATHAAGYERITAVFQPHRVTRTLALAGEFAPAFDGVTNVVVTDIYTAGEPNPTGVTGDIVHRSIQARGAGAHSIYCADLKDVPEVLDSLHDESDVVLLLGAGDVASVATRLSGGFD